MELLERFPVYKNYLYAAFVISFLPGMFLYFAKFAIVLSFAQLGTFVSIFYLLYSMAGVFVSFNEPIFLGLVLVALFVMNILFMRGLTFACREKSYSDLALGIIMLLAAVLAIW